MKNRKRTLALILASVLTVSAFAGCGTPTETSSKGGTSAAASKPASAGTSATAAAAEGELDLSEKVTFTAMAGFRPQHADFNDMEIVKKLGEAANVEIKWELVPDESLKEKKNLALSTGDLPDVMLGMLDSNDIQKNASLFLPLDEYSQYTPNMNKIMEENEEVSKYMKISDGHYYSLAFWHEKPYEGDYTDLYVNQDWLTKLNLQAPNTIDEFEKMLIAFRDNDPNGNGEKDEIPMTFIINHQYFGLFGMYGIFGSVDSMDRLWIKDGKVYLTADKDEWKEATKWFAKLYSQNLMDVEGFTQDRSMLFAKGKSDPVLMGCTNAFLIDNVVGADRVPSYTYVLPLQHANGDGGRTGFYNTTPISSRSTSTVSKKCENPERLIHWLDLNLDPEYSLQNTYGAFGKQLVDSTDSAFKYEFAIAPDGMSQDDYRFKDAPANFPAFIPSDLYGTLKPAPDVARKISFMEQAKDYLTKESIPPVLFTDEESKELATVQTAIKDYVLQQQSLFITGKADIDKEWDNFVTQLKNLGSERYVEIYQAAVDRYNQG